MNIRSLLWYYQSGSDKRKQLESKERKRYEGGECESLYQRVGDMSTGLRKLQIIIKFPFYSFTNVDSVALFTLIGKEHT
jgi:long-subunit acyl-CoA synthetase (AMP-forming)